MCPRIHCRNILALNFHYFTIYYIYLYFHLTPNTLQMPSDAMNCLFASVLIQITPQLKNFTAMDLHLQLMNEMAVRPKDYFVNISFKIVPNFLNIFSNYLNISFKIISPIPNKCNYYKILLSNVILKY